MIVSIEVPFDAKRQAVSNGGGLSRKAVNAKNRCDKTLVLMLTRAYYWQQLLDTGEAKSVQEIATKFKLDRPTVSKILKLNLLSPEIKLAVLNGTQPEGMTWERCKKPFPVVWEEQGEWFGF